MSETPVPVPIGNLVLDQLLLIRVELIELREGLSAINARLQVLEGLLKR